LSKKLKSSSTKSKQEWIELKGVSENNLQSVSVKIPKYKLTVVTGLSGSGKSSLVFDSLFMESQRRFLNSLSNYSKNFLDNLKKPEIDSLSGLSPSIAIDQRTASSSPRSTVGTMTESLDYLRLLYARVGTAVCPVHNQVVSKFSKEELIAWAGENLKGKKVRVLSPVVRDQKGEFKKELSQWEALGFVKVLYNGELTFIYEIPKLNKRKSHTIDLVVDQFKFEDKMLDRLNKALARSFEVEENFISFEINGVKKTFSLKSSCAECGYSFPDLEPRHFSFNNKQGACEYCGGLGREDIEEYETEDRIGSGGMYMNVSTKQYKSVSSNYQACSECGGTRLNERARSVLVDGSGIDEFCSLPIDELLERLSDVELERPEISTPILKELLSRLGYLNEVGLSYLSLDRGSETLSGGERQRLRLASQLGNPMIGVLYVLDEPSIGLHAHDHEKLLKVIEKIKDQGNTVVVVEHDEETMKRADYIIEVGPGAGRMGGKIVAQEPYKDFVKRKPLTLTGSYLTHDTIITRIKSKKTDDKKPKNADEFFGVKGAKLHNLNNVDVDLPFNSLIGVSGVSGSGKSSLIMDTVANAKKEIKNVEFTNFDKFKVINTIDQKPIGKTPRSIPATYVGAFNLIRALYARIPESQVRGFGAGHFSFNSDLGRCTSCQGMGVKKINSGFLSNVSVDCIDCSGARFKPEILSVRFKDKNISDVLNLSIQEAFTFFENQPSIRRKLQTLLDVGLGYLKIGQDSTTLSGGEAQRVKLGKELSKSYKGQVLYILDEPTTGLHFEDVERLLNLLSKLVEKGHTVIVIEHQLDLLAECDHLIDLGPFGGRHGGKIVDQGAPKDVAKRSKGVTGKCLKAHLS